MAIVRVDGQGRELINTTGIVVTECGTPCQGQTVPRNISFAISGCNPPPCPENQECSLLYSGGIAVQQTPLPCSWQCWLNLPTGNCDSTPQPVNVAGFQLQPYQGAWMLTCNVWVWVDINTCAWQPPPGCCARTAYLFRGLPLNGAPLFNSALLSDPSSFSLSFESFYPCGWPRPEGYPEMTTGVVVESGP